VTDTPELQPASHRWLAWPVLLAGWLVPGLGHLLLGRWGRALVIFFAVCTLAGVGVWLGGYVFPPEAEDAFEWLGLLSNLGAGGVYFLCRMLELAQSDVSRAAGDYGTRFFATAGVLNLLSALDAHDIARGRKR
jgi:hypothetical protein